MKLAQRLAEVAWQAAAQPEESVLRTRLLANLCAGFGQHDARRRFFGMQEPRVFSGPGGDAFQLAVEMHARTQDDFHPAGKTHVGAVVIPSVAATQSVRMLEGIAAGYEVTCLVGAAYGEVCQQRGFRPTPALGPLGAAAGAAVALGLDKARTSEAIAMAAALAGGSNQAWLDGSDEWLLQVGTAARVGVECALLASRGIHGANYAIEGEAGFATTILGDPHGSRLLDALDTTAEGRTGEVAIKLFPISGIAQGPTAAALQISGSLSDTVPATVSVEIAERDAKYPGTDNPGPFKSRSDALMSLRRCVATALMRGTQSYEDVTAPLAPAEIELIRQIKILARDDLDVATTFVRVVAGGVTYESRIDLQELLYPSWSAFSTDIERLATMFEVRPEVAADLAQYCGGDLNARPLLEMWRHYGSDD